MSTINELELVLDSIIDKLHHTESLNGIQVKQLLADYESISQEISRISHQK